MAGGALGPLLLGRHGGAALCGDGTGLTDPVGYGCVAALHSVWVQMSLSDVLGRTKVGRLAEAALAEKGRGLRGGAPMLLLLDIPQCAVPPVSCVDVALADHGRALGLTGGDICSCAAPALSFRAGVVDKGV